jgi:selenocysteine lyase/cysteine desulfurase
MNRCADFAGFDDWTFLNCAYHGPMPRVAEAALAAAVELRRNPSLIRNEYHFTFPDAYRRAIAALVNADPDTVSLVDSATAGTMILVSGLDWRDGDEVVIPRGEFPSNRLPWQHLGRRGVTLREIDLGTGPDCEARLADVLSARTRVLQVSWVSFTDGRRLDPAPLAAACRDRDVLFVVDGSQGVGGLPFDMAAAGCDVLLGAGYKWLLGPYGLGYVVIRPELAERLDVANVNWFATRQSEDFNRLADLPLAPRPGAMRFDMNEPANFFNVAAGTAAARYIAEVTPAAVEAHARALLDRLIAGLPAGWTPLAADPPRSNILCVRGPDEKATDRALAHLRARRVALSAREGAIRVSPHVYNTASDIDRLLEALAESASARHDESAIARDDVHARLTSMLGLAEHWRAEGR